MKPPSVIVAVGYSVRSLVEACSKAGLNCVAVDHFGDADTRAFAEGRWVKFELVDDHLMAGDAFLALQNIASEFRRAGHSVALLLAGGMESLGDVVEQLRSIGEVFGPSESQRARLRDWRFLEKAAKAVGICFPNTEACITSGEGWLWKPSCGAGGLKIVRAAESTIERSDGYWQQLVLGRQLGVLCVLQEQGCCIVGATRSLDSVDWPGPTEFIYRGSIGPVQLSVEERRRVIDLCAYIREQIDFVGLLQFDFIQGDDGRPWLLECNPRWTAGIEVLLGNCKGGGRAKSLVVDGLLQQGLSGLNELWSDDGWSFAKAIVYANKQMHLSEQMSFELQRQSQAGLQDFSWLADVPYGTQTIEAGNPIATVRAGIRHESSSFNEEVIHTRLLVKLRDCADRLLQLIESGCET